MCELAWAYLGLASCLVMRGPDSTRSRRDPPSPVEYPWISWILESALASVGTRGAALLPLSFCPCMVWELWPREDAIALHGQLREQITDPEGFLAKCELMLSGTLSYIL